MVEHDLLRVAGFQGRLPGVFKVGQVVTDETMPGDVPTVNLGGKLNFPGESFTAAIAALNSIAATD